MNKRNIKFKVIADVTCDMCQGTGADKVQVTPAFEAECNNPKVKAGCWLDVECNSCGGSGFVEDDEVTIELEELRELLK